jgi:hypothetical protein
MTEKIIKPGTLIKPLVDGKKNIKIVIDGIEKEAVYRIFKSNRRGYGLYGVVKIDGMPYRISLNLIEFG